MPPPDSGKMRSPGTEAIASIDIPHSEPISIDAHRPAMAQEPSHAIVTHLCEQCSKLNVQHLTHPLFPCRNPYGSCSTPPPVYQNLTADIVLGTVDEIKRRRQTCALCKLVAESLDKEPSDLDGTCRFCEVDQFCNFRLPGRIKDLDPTVTHFHLTQVSVVFDTETESRFNGPSLPWEVKERDDRGSHFILNLQARARSCPRTGDHPVAAPQTVQEFLDAVGGRYVGTQVDVELVRKWLHDCEFKHGKLCEHFSQLPGGGDKAPTFVIDVIQSCLVDTPLQCRYVALSYVWGTSPVFRHLLENSQDLRKPNSLRSLPIPATIRDSITLVHAIGERYLWVDSICIVQDDFKMQQGEIMRMGSIYSNALFTIIAAAGDNANNGLPGVNPGSREQEQKILKIGDDELLTVIDVRRRRNGIDDTVWAQRAWTFQERVLSSRLLVVSENQVYWSCRAATYSEERVLEHLEDVDRLHLVFPQKPRSELRWEFLASEEYCNLYDDLLESYRERRLTYQTDLLNAFNGVTEILGATQNDTFLWGLPESHFSHGIIWEVFDHCFRNHVEVPILKSDGSKETVPIPSWSWAAWSTKLWTHNRNFSNLWRRNVRPAIRFYLVDSERKLVRIEESWPEHPKEFELASWEEAQPVLPSLPLDLSSRIGQLHFWTSHANVRAIRTWRMRTADYVLIPEPGPVPDLGDNPDHSEIIQQDFIVVAARGTGITLILLAIEWKDGVAYRVGKTEVSETQWLEVKNRQWRLIVLG